MNFLLMDGRTLQVLRPITRIVKGVVYVARTDAKLSTARSWAFYELAEDQSIQDIFLKTVT